jgi:hypothetical protein
MIPKLIKGRSFKGAAAYLLHDTHDHATSDRVSWTETLNLATQNPDTAWKVMAATAMNADRLKSESGIKATGRKAQHCVLHLVLSWHPEEKQALTREDMTAAAESAIRALGGSDRQALIIGHNDSPHPHIHILLNRHCPETGRIMPSSNEKLKLSAWAQDYERRRGRIFCAERVHNNDARQRGDYTRAAPPQPRQIIEADKVLRTAANDNPDRLAQLRAAQRSAIGDLGRRTRALKTRHADSWQSLQEADHARRAAAMRETREVLAATRQSLIEQYRPLWRQLRLREDAERVAFKAREQTQFGRLRNAFSAINTAHSAIDGPRPNLASKIWKSMTSAPERTALHEQALAAQRRALEAEQRSAIRSALMPIHARHQLTQRKNAERYAVERLTMIETQKAERTAMREEWRCLSRDHKAQTHALKASLDGKRSFAAQSPVQSLFQRLKDQSLQRPAIEKAPEQDNERDRER